MRATPWSFSRPRAALATAVLATTWLALAVLDHPYAQASGVAAASSAPAYTSAQPCRADTFAHVHDPARLRLVSPCATVSGEVRTVKWQPVDGNWRIELALDTHSAPFVPDARVPLEVDVIPADVADVALPRVGERVTASGAWVRNRNHSDELQLDPAWSVAPIGESAVHPAAVQDADLRVHVNGPAAVTIGQTFALSASVRDRKDRAVPAAHLWLEVLPAGGPGLQWRTATSDSMGSATLDIVALYRAGPYQLSLYVERHGRVEHISQPLEVS